MSKEPETSQHFKRIDWVILPLLSFLTLLFMFSGSELTARHFFPEKTSDECRIDDATIGFKFKANCTSRMKTAEGPWVTNQYNDCGYRTRESCGPKPKGTTRIALIGSSVAEGWFVPYDQTFAARTARELTERCGHPVEIQNLGRQLTSVGRMYHRLDEALALKPDVLLIAISPYDVETTVDADVQDRYKPVGAFHSIPMDTAEARQKHLLIKRLQGLVKDSRTLVAAEHYLFADPVTYLRMYLLYGDKADFLRPPFTPAWEDRFRNVDTIVGEMAQKAHDQSIPVVMIEVPNLPQVSLLAMKTHPVGTDPRAMNKRLQSIAAMHAIRFVDVLDDFQKAPQANKLFYLVNGHLTGAGYASVSGPLVKQLIAGPDPLIAGCSAIAQQGF